MERIKHNQEIWKKFYETQKRFLYWPSEDLVAFCNVYLNNTLSGKRVIDIGCGAGRNLLLTGKLGAEVYGIDYSKEAISEAYKFLKKEKFSPILKKSNSTNIPYEANYFDLAILWGIFHYLSQEDQEKTKKEVRRILKDESWIIFTLRSVHDSRYGLGKKIENNVFEQEKQGRDNIRIQYWDEESARKFFDLENILVGERIRAPIGRLKIKSAHWMIAGKIKK